MKFPTENFEFGIFWLFFWFIITRKKSKTNDDKTKLTFRFIKNLNKFSETKKCQKLFSYMYKTLITPDNIVVIVHLLFISFVVIFQLTRKFWWAFGWNWFELTVIDWYWQCIHKHTQTHDGVRTLADWKIDLSQTFLSSQISRLINQHSMFAHTHARTQASKQQKRKSQLEYDEGTNRLEMRYTQFFYTHQTLCGFVLFSVFIFFSSW